MKNFDIATELIAIKARLLDHVRDDLSRKLPAKDAEDILGSVAYEVDISFRAIENLTHEIARSGK
jgi:CYTH domain-containing protein